MSLAAIEIRLMVRGSLIGPMRSITLGAARQRAAGLLDPDDVARLGAVRSAGRMSNSRLQLAVGRRHQADAVAAVGLLVEAEDLLAGRCRGGG